MNDHKKTRILADNEEVEISGCPGDVLFLTGQIIDGVLKTLRKVSWVNYMSLISLIDRLIAREISHMTEMERNAFLDSKNKIPNPKSFY